jgi:hypothetical protein
MPRRVRQATAEESQREELEVLEVHERSAEKGSHQAAPNGQRWKSLIVFFCRFHL